MKKTAVFLLLLLPALGFGQSLKLPPAVVNSFNKIFHGGVISSWTGNNTYSYTSDWDDDTYFDDFDYDGYPDGYYTYYDEPVYDDMGDDMGDDESYYYNDDLDYNYYVPDDYQTVVWTPPTQYQLNFHYKGMNMSGFFKPDGTFVIAKGRITLLPGNIAEVIKNTFKGNMIRLEHAKEILMTPQYPPSNPVYRVKVFVRHNGYSIMKIDSKGNVISNHHN
jgi:hypothetical protein